MNKKLFCLILYVVLSVGFGLIAATTLFVDVSSWKEIFVIFFPSLLLPQTLLAVIGISLKSEITIDITLTALSLLYYFVLLYPLYRLTTLSKNSKPIRRTRLKVIAVFLAATHVLMIFISVILIKA